MLRLRVLRARVDLDAYWQIHLANEYERTHQSRYPGGRSPIRYRGTILV